MGRKDEDVERVGNEDKEMREVRARQKGGSVIEDGTRLT